MKKYFLSTLLIGAILVPALASAEATTTASTTVSTSQNFTVCQQGAIEKRDTAIGVARATYNTSMTQALNARKEAEKSAVAITDATAKRVAVKTAVDTYKKAVTLAQEILVKSRKEALATFELDTKTCRQTKTEQRTALTAEKKAEVKTLKEEQKVEVKTLQAERKVAVEAKKAEIKTIRETLKSKMETLRSLLGKKVQTNTTVNSTTTAK